MTVALLEMGNAAFMVCGGLREAVAGFGEWIGVLPDPISAVGMRTNPLAGEW